MAKKKRYSDLDLDFLTHPVTGDVSLKFDEEAVKRALRNLVFMGIHEKPFHPEIRSEVRKLLFENFTPVIKFELEKEIEDIINAYEPRVSLDEVVVNEEQDFNRLDVTIRFRVVGIADERFELEFPLERIR